MTAAGTTWLDAQARRAPRADAIRAGGRSHSYGELAERVARAAAVLAAAGLRAGDRLGVLLPGTLEHVVVVYAAQRLGAVHAPLDPRLPEGEIARRLEVAETALLVADGSVAAPIAGAVERVVAPADLAGGAHPAAAPPPPALPALPALDAPATWIFTSGTTGTAEPVPLTLGNHWASAEASARNLGRRADDVWLCCLPLAHVGGLAIVFRAALAGVPLVLEERFDVARVAARLAGGEVTLASLVPTMLARLLERDGPPPSPRLRAILLGGGPIAPALVAAARERGFPALPTYGMTETASQVATAPPGAHGEAVRPGAVGPPLFGVEIAVHAQDGARLGAGETGEIRVRGPMVAPSWTDGDGWLATGDLGRLDAEGTLWIAGRRDEMIVTGGENVSPARVEEEIAAHPAVAECAVVGVSDPEWGRAVAAAVVLREAVAPAAEPAALAALAADCRGHLAPYEVPKRWVVVAGLPRTALGKVARAAVRRLFENTSG